MVGSWQGLQRAALGTLGNLARQGQCLEELRGQAAVGALQQLTADDGELGPLAAGVLLELGVAAVAVGHGQAAVAGAANAQSRAA